MKAAIPVTMKVAIPIMKAARLLIHTPMAATIIANGIIAKPIIIIPPQGRRQESSLFLAAPTYFADLYHQHQT